MPGEADLLVEMTALNQQAISFYQQSRYTEAEPPFKDALAIRENQLLIKCYNCLRTEASRSSAVSFTSHAAVYLPCEAIASFICSA